MGRPGDKIHIPAPTDKAIATLLMVKPTSDMPRQGAHPFKAKKASKPRSKRSK
ncbi:MAG: hypothetical protein HYX73_09005 [Acidobacteria bacterium]|nr:hypothetical protein [Acidobacteriota bacterium]